MICIVSNTQHQGQNFCSQMLISQGEVDFIDRLYGGRDRQYSVISVGDPNKLRGLRFNDKEDRILMLGNVRNVATEEFKAEISFSAKRSGVPIMHTTGQIFIAEEAIYRAEHMSDITTLEETTPF